MAPGGQGGCGEGRRLPKPIVEQFVAEAVVAALTCDRGNELASSLQQASTEKALTEKTKAETEKKKEKAETEKQLPEKVKDAWADVKKKQIDPWAPLVLALLAWLAVAIVLARLLLLFVTRDIATQLTHIRWARPALVAAGSVILTLGAGLGVGIWSLLTLNSELVRDSPRAGGAAGSWIAGHVPCLRHLRHAPAARRVQAGNVRRTLGQRSRESPGCVCQLGDRCSRRLRVRR